MRRKIIIMVVSLAFLLSLGGAEQALVKRVTDEALSGTQAILSDIRQEALDDAMQKAHALDQAWDKKAKVLELIVNHSSTDEVRYAFSRLLAALEQRDNATAMVYACELEGALEHVYERQAVMIENII